MTDEKQETIQDMDKVLRGCCQFDYDDYVKSFNCYSGAKALYDAGYRKEGEQKPRPELEKEIVRIITEFRWGYMQVGRRDRPEKVAKLEKHAMTQIRSLMDGEIEQKVKEAVEFIDSYLVTTVHPEGDMHHIDDKEWQSVKDRILKSEKQNGH